MAGTDDSTFPPDRRKDLETREIIDRVKTDVSVEQERRVHSLTKLTGILLGVLIVIQLALGIWSIILTQQNGDQNDAIQEQANQILAQQQALQQSREESVRTTCEELNQRHDDTVVQFDKLLAIGLLTQIMQDPASTDTQRNAAARQIKVVNLLNDPDEVHEAYLDATKRVGDPAKQAAITQRAGTVLLINKLVPKEDCQKRVDRLTATPTPTATPLPTP